MLIVLPNPQKEQRNQRTHRVGFRRVREVLEEPTVEHADDRPLGYEEEGRVRLLGLFDGRVMLLVFEPVEIGTGELAVKPISFRRATRSEARFYYQRVGR